MLHIPCDPANSALYRHLARYGLGILLKCRNSWACCQPEVRCNDNNRITWAKSLGPELNSHRFAVRARCNGCRPRRFGWVEGGPGIEDCVVRWVCGTGWAVACYVDWIREENRDRGCRHAAIGDSQSHGRFLLKLPFSPSQNSLRAGKCLYHRLTGHDDTQARRCSDVALPRQILAHKLGGRDLLAVGCVLNGYKKSSPGARQVPASTETASG